MGFYKKVKFPFEVTKGKAKDLYKLRFMRKSELEPSLRHNLRHNVRQLDKQLDLWFKEQLFTIGSLTKEQEKIYSSRKQLKSEIRRSKKREYVRRQDEIRKKLTDIKMKIMMMKVVQKFKDNVKIAKSSRQADELKGDADILHISGNKQLLHDPKEEGREKSASRSRDRTNKDLEIANSAKAENESTRKSHEVDHVSDSSTIGSDDNDDSDDDLQDVDKTLDWSDSLLHGQRMQSSQGPRMETIPEEAEEVDVEIADLRGFPRLTQRRLQLLNRSQSKRDVFDDCESVPLLPEVSGHHVQLTSNIKQRPSETVDKGTQTSDKPKPHTTKRKKASNLRKHVKNDDKIVSKKTIVVKIPRSYKYSEREGSYKSNSGHCGSESDDDDYNDATTDTDFAFGVDSDLISSETESEYSDDDDSDENSDAGNQSSFNKLSSDQFSLTLTKYKTTLRRKTENGRDHGPFVQSFPTVTNIDADLPNITTYNIQNPFSIRYKERSFYVKAIETERQTGSARSQRKRDAFSDETFIGHNQDDTRKLNYKRGEDIRKTLRKDDSKVLTDYPEIAVYGRSSDSSTPQPVPPISPGPTSESPATSPRRNVLHSYRANLLHQQKRAKFQQQDKIHDIVSCEPVQKYERTRSGKIRPFGTPRLPNREIPSLNPSLKEQYYRDKLLKAERDRLLRVNMKMKRFMDNFDQGSDIAKLPAIPSHTSGEPETGTQVNSPGRRKTIGNIFFKVYQPEQDVESERKVVPGAKTTSLRLLKSCRYLREYNPLAENSAEKETSWNMRKHSEYDSGYIANVRVNIS